MKKYVLIFILLVSVTAFAQKKMNAYEYIIVPSKFDFQEEANEFGINLLLKYKFQQLGFEVYLDTDELPQRLRTNTCLYAHPVLHSKSNMFKTVISIELFDCNNKSLYKTQDGVSTSKNIKASYNEAIRKSLKSFGDYKLSYSPNDDLVVIKEDKTVKKIGNVLASESKLNSGGFNYKGINYLLIKKGVMLFEIQNKETKSIDGKIIVSGLKKDIYHIEFNGKIGFGYYGEDESLVMEFMSSDNSVEMISLPKVN